MFIINIYMRNYFKSLKTPKGFTLIELLIVIAVIGILAAVVLAAIDPAEQLKRGRDSSRIQTVATLGHAMAAYVTIQQSNIAGGFTLPAATNTWQTMLVNSGDIKVTASAPGTGSGCTPAVNCQNNFGYNPVGNEFVLWTNVESKSAITKAANGVATGCGVGNVAVYAYDSTLGQAGSTCISASSAPSTGLTLH
jgi:prepilin-type N-terminal cleavage/methylation domain-containing protein